VIFQIYGKLQQTKGKLIHLPFYKGGDHARPARANFSLGHPTSADIATDLPPACDSVKAPSPFISQSLVRELALISMEIKENSIIHLKNKASSHAGHISGGQGTGTSHHVAGGGA
jgi:hypothetical protein